LPSEFWILVNARHKGNVSCQPPPYVSITLKCLCLSCLQCFDTVG